MPKRKLKKLLFSGKSFKKLQKKLLRRIEHTNIAAIYLVLAVLFFAAWGSYQIHLQTRLSFDQNVVFAQNVATQIATPKRMQIPSLEINLPVEQTIIQKGIWQISEKGISHLAVSAYPGQKQNGIYYGHNTSDRLGRLSAIRQGDKIVITDQQNRQYVYMVYDILVVSPSEMDKLLAYKGESITVYTCTGFADSQRLLIKAKRI